MCVFPFTAIFIAAKLIYMFYNRKFNNIKVNWTVQSGQVDEEPRFCDVADFLCFFSKVAQC